MAAACVLSRTETELARKRRSKPRTDLACYCIRLALLCSTKFILVKTVGSACINSRMSLPGGSGEHRPSPSAIPAAAALSNPGACGGRTTTSLRSMEPHSADSRAGSRPASTSGRSVSLGTNPKHKSHTLTLVDGLNEHPVSEDNQFNDRLPATCQQKTTVCTCQEHDIFYFCSCLPFLLPAAGVQFIHQAPHRLSIWMSMK